MTTPRTTPSNTTPHADEPLHLTAAHARARSSLWPGVERAFLRQHPACEMCGARAGLNVHHRVPFSYCIPLGRPDLEFEPQNLVTLCTKGADHHLLIGHLDFFQSYNPTLEQDLAAFAQQDAKTIRASRAWRNKVHERPPSYAHMTEEQRVALRHDLDARFPPGARSTRKG